MSEGSRFIQHWGVSPPSKPPMCDGASAPIDVAPCGRPGDLCINATHITAPYSCGYMSNFLLCMRAYTAGWVRGAKRPVDGPPFHPARGVYWGRSQYPTTGVFSRGRGHRRRAPAPKPPGCECRIGRFETSGSGGSGGEAPSVAAPAAITHRGVLLRRPSSDSPNAPQ